jgi:putative sugar O-methyltransferase
MKLFQNNNTVKSISDNGLYPDFCQKAAQDSKTFFNFRSEKVYTAILEHVDFEHGEKYLNEIQFNKNELLQNFDEFKKNDDFGNPILCNYPAYGKISPTTLRYIKVLSDLIKLFKNLQSFKICEIGVGYGGQCRIISSAYNLIDYTLVDLKQVLMLVQRYLDSFALRSSVSYKTMNELCANEYDLVISNYAFSELPRNVQEVYLYKVILNSKRGYITFNNIGPINFSFSLSELLELIPNSHVVEEIPLTHENNCIIIWGDDKVTNV